MKYLFNRIGVWIFIAALGLYLGSGMLLEKLHHDRLEAAKNAHVQAEQLNIGSTKSAVIKGVINKFSQLPLQIYIASPSNQSEIQNNNLNVTVEQKIIGDTLTISINQSNTEAYMNLQPIKIMLPKGIEKLDVSGVNRIEMENRFSAPELDFGLTVLDCVPNIKLDNLSLHRFNINSKCLLEPNKELLVDEPFNRHIANNIQFGENITLHEMNANLTAGHLSVDASFSSDLTTLTLSDAVTVNAHSRFLRNTHFLEQ